MKRKGFVFVCLMTLSLVFGLVSAASAYTLSLQATSDGSTPKTSFARGENLYLNIVLDNAGGVAGCAFSVFYPTNVLTAPATNAEGISGDITSIFPFTYDTTQTHRENSTSNAGKIYLAGSAINATTGGAKYASGEVVLFTIKFQVKNDAPLGSFDLSLAQTLLLNPNAGWGIDTNQDGTKDTPEPIPVLVGAVPNTDGNWGNLAAAFPVLLGDQANPFSTVIYDACEVGEEPVDTDGDGIPDDWEITHFGNLTTANATSDYDKDGYTDKQEYLNGAPYDPKVQDPPGGPGYNPLAVNYWEATIHAAGQVLGGVSSYDAVIGADAATSVEDAPPAPPSYSVKMALYAPDWAGPFLRDVRQWEESKSTYRWTLAVNPHGNIMPPDARSATLSWDPSGFGSEGFFRLRSGSADAPGSIVVADMRTTTEYVVTGGDSDQYFTIEWSLEETVELTLNQGWNLISLPVTPTDGTLTILFPDATVAYKFDQAYQSVTSLEPGYGYWVKVTTGGTYTFSGSSFDSYAATLGAGWHLMGAVNGVDLTPTTAPSGSISVMYGFDAAYFSTTKLSAGGGYWVKIINSCDFTLAK